MKTLIFVPRSLNTLFFIALLFFVGMHSSNVIADTNPYKEFRSLLSEIKKAVLADKMPLALDLLSKARRKLDELEKRPVIDEEALRWDMAQINLDRADSMQNRHQIAYFANESVNRWQEYIEWYKSLDENQFAIIKSKPSSNRIQRAVRQMGNAYMRRDNLESHSIRDIFFVYLDLPPEYLSSQSINLWKSWLFRCPSWQPVDSASLRGLKVKFESNGEFCMEDWDDFYGYLEEWMNKQELSSVKKRSYDRWQRDLGYALGHERE